MRKSYANIKEDLIMKKKTGVVFALLVAACLLLTGCGAKTASEQAAGPQQELLSGIYTAELTIKGYGTIRFEMDADKAPISVTNFVNLAESGFYNGLTFHRIIDGFMMQGGASKSEKTPAIRGEFSANGVKNDQSHTRGAVSMARTNDMNSASSQFFIVHKDSTFLDGQYACFGYVTDGMDVVDAICENTPVTDNNGSVSEENQPIIESIVITKG